MHERSCATREGKRKDRSTRGELNKCESCEMLFSVPTWFSTRGECGDAVEP